MSKKSENETEGVHEKKYEDIHEAVERTKDADCSGKRGHLPGWGTMRFQAWKNEN